MFGQAPKCPVCDKKVYFNERVHVLGEDYHRACFKCNNCKKGLELGQQRVHGETLYCGPCYSKLFGPKGYGFGGSLNDTGLNKDGSMRDDARNSLAREQAINARKSKAGLKPVNPSGRSTLVDPQQCYKCGKTLGAAERVHALGEYWHKSCLTCSDCGKILQLGTFYEHDHKPWCETCYHKNFHTKGYGFGGALKTTGKYREQGGVQEEEDSD